MWKFNSAAILYYLSIGSNIGAREKNVDEACRLLSENCGTLHRRSEYYYSAPCGYTSEHDYVNICVALQSSLSPEDLLRRTQDIERALGRKTKTVVTADGQRMYSDRTIDIDLLQGWNDEGKELICSTATLTLPHPRMQERPFVMIPLLEIKPME